MDNTDWEKDSNISIIDINKADRVEISTNRADKAEDLDISTVDVNKKIE